MLKRIVVVLLALLFQAGVGYSKPELAEVKAFRIYNVGSENGEFIFMLAGDRKAIFSSPIGVKDMVMYKGKGAIVIGNPDVSWIIHDVWDNDKQGYRSVVRMKGAEDNIVGYAKPIGRYDSRPSLSFFGKTSFRFYGLKGDVDVYDLSNGKRIDGGPDNKFSRDGEMLFVITGHNEGRFYGNAGSSDVDVFRDDTSVIFLETTPSGNKQVTIVQNRWNKKHDGFECTHIRNTLVPKFLSDGTELIRSIYTGVARPQ